MILIFKALQQIYTHKTNEIKNVYQLDHQHQKNIQVQYNHFNDDHFPIYNSSLFIYNIYCSIKCVCMCMIIIIMDEVFLCL